MQTSDRAFLKGRMASWSLCPAGAKRGVLIGLGGGTADTFSNDLSTLDVYDIANSVWYHQQTKGNPPSVRVNPCAVVASAPDASSFQIYLFGGQNLQPYVRITPPHAGIWVQMRMLTSPRNNKSSTPDMYILSIPSFTWIQVDQRGEQPAPRAGHSCNLRDGQIILVGGYVGTLRPL